MTTQGKEKARAKSETLKHLIPKTPSPRFEYYDDSRSYFDYSQVLPKKFFHLFMKLPKEIRDRIYAYVAAAWAPHRRYPKNMFIWGGPWGKEPQNWFSIARRPNAVPIFRGTKNWTGFAKSTIQFGSSNWQAKSDCMFSSKKGILDYFKKGEYRNIEELVYTLTQIPGPDIGIQDDFLDWFWRNVTLEFRAFYVGSGIYKWYNPTLSTVPKYLSNIRHLSLEFQPTHQRHVHSFRKPLDSRQEDPEFRKFCIFVAKKMPNLQILLLWVSVCVPDLELIVEGKAGQGWIAALRSIPVAQRFVVHLHLNFAGVRSHRTSRYADKVGRYTGPKLDDKGKQDLVEKGEKDLTRLLMPNSLRNTLSI